MSEAVLDQDRAKALTLIKARLEAALQETRRDEARLKRILEMRRLKRRIRTVKTA